MKKICLCILMIWVSIASAGVPSGIPQKAAAGLTKARQWRSDAILVMVEANDYSETGNFLLKFSYYSPSDHTGLWITTGGGVPDNLMQAGTVNWGTQAIPANFADLPDAVQQARSSGMGAVVDHAILRVGNQGLKWEITPDFNDPRFQVYFVAALPKSKQDNKQEEDALWDKASDEFRKFDWDAAIADFTKYIQLHPENRGAYDNRGEAYLGKNMLDQAFADFSKALQMDSTDWQSYWRIGNIYAAKKMYQKAIDFYTNAIKFDTSKEPRLYAGRAKTYTDMKSYDQAIADYTKALEFTNAAADFYQTERAQYFHARGYAYAQKDMIDEAIADFKKALELDPKDDGAKKNIEILEEEKNDNP
jgi:tetratricopeptide (TPR) repeat protein